MLEKRGVDPEKDVRAPPAQTELLQKAKQTQQEGEEVSRRSTSIRSGEDSNKQKQRAFSATTSIPSGKGSSKFRRKLYEDLACSTDTGNEINDLPGSSARRPSTSSSRPLTGSSVDLSVSSAPNVLDQCEVRRIQNVCVCVCVYFNFNLMRKPTVMAAIIQLSFLLFRSI